MYVLLHPKFARRARRGELPWRPTQRVVVLEPCIVLHRSWRAAVLQVANAYMACDPATNWHRNIKHPCWSSCYLSRVGGAAFVFAYPCDSRTCYLLCAPQLFMLAYTVNGLPPCAISLL